MSKSLALRWIEYASQTEDEKRELLFDVEMEFRDLVYESATAAWPVLLEAAHNTHVPEVQALLGAGNLENFINKYGPEYIDEIERLTHDDMAFRDVCVHAYPREEEATKDVYQRIIKLKELPLSDEM